MKYLGWELGQHQEGRDSFCERWGWPQQVLSMVRDSKASCWMSEWGNEWMTSLLKRGPQEQVLRRRSRRGIPGEWQGPCGGLPILHNKNLIWGNYEKPTHYAIWFMFWHVAIIGLIAEKPSFPELYGLCFNCRPSQSPSPLPCVWSSNCLKTQPRACCAMLQASAWAEVWWTEESSLAIRRGA